MSYSLALCLQAEPVRFATHTSITGAAGGYVPIGTSFSAPGRLVGLQNFTDAPLMISFDGVNDHLPLAGALMLDVAANSTLSQGYYAQQGQRLYVRSMTAQGYANPTVGNVWLTVFDGRV